MIIDNDRHSVIVDSVFLCPSWSSLSLLPSVLRELPSDGHTGDNFHRDAKFHQIFPREIRNYAMNLGPELRFSHSRRLRLPPRKLGDKSSSSLQMKLST